MDEDKLAKHHGITIENVPGDGYCLYHAFLKATQQHIKFHSLRDMVHEEKALKKELEEEGDVDQGTKIIQGAIESLARSRGAQVHRGTTIAARKLGAINRERMIRQYQNLLDACRATNSYPGQCKCRGSNNCAEKMTCPCFIAGIPCVTGKCSCFKKCKQKETKALPLPNWVEYLESMKIEKPEIMKRTSQRSQRSQK
eukprot:gnl/Carplike_NY0171/1673_a2260_545.p1 GENE.gnl/Carplike_NY0171/1673_a2260_545~~gnl/Carplike_NY0171/1673_a2260_545.p1  ORF type:complete len:198 (+),score=12.31 gnl/Carplike_NY0171/1673_a2260_545:109-702(+)